MNNSKQPYPDTLKDLKQQARRLRSGLADDLTTISHSKSLEMMAHQRGYKDWNTLHASISNRPALETLELNETVQGVYLGQAFKGELVSIKILKSGYAYHVSIQLEKAIDVVTFDSFSNFRRRLSCTVDANGISPAKTSNGKPHMALEL